MANQTQLTDGKFDAQVEHSAKALQISRAVHSRIEQSNGWLSSYKWTAVDTATSKYFHIKTNSTKNPHGNFTVHTEGKVTIEFFENPTLTTDGTGIAENCLNRQTVVAPGTTCFVDPTLTNDGTLLEIGMEGSSGKFCDVGGTETDRGYWLLHLNEDYLIKVTNDEETAKDICIAYVWHEHDENVKTRHS